MQLYNIITDSRATVFNTYSHCKASFSLSLYARALGSAQNKVLAEVFSPSTNKYLQYKGDLADALLSGYTQGHERWCLICVVQKLSARL